MPAFSRGRHADEAPLSVDATDQDGPARAVHVDHFYPELFPTRSRVWIEFTHDLLEGEISGEAHLHCRAGQKAKHVS